MANQIIFGKVKTIEPDKKRKEFAIGLTRDRVIRLKKKHPFFKVVMKTVKSVRRFRMPVFANIGKEDKVVKSVYCPRETVVESISPVIRERGSEAHLVTLRYSPAKHFAFTNHPNHVSTMDVLHDSLANQTPAYVADCYFNPQIVAAKQIKPASGIQMHKTTFDRPESHFELVTEWLANKLFQKVTNGESCSAPQIPFDFVENGCVWRAHEMCRLILEEGVAPIKVWIFDPNFGLNPDTPNHPKCEVSWSFHVAPAVNTVAGLRIIDPALFSKPVSTLEWRERMKSCQSKILYSGYHVMLMTEVFSTFQADPEYSRTHTEIRTLQHNFAQFIAANKRPPYKKCLRKTL